VATDVISRPVRHLFTYIIISTSMIAVILLENDQFMTLHRLEE